MRGYRTHRAAQTPGPDPALRPIKAGWAAYGDGWAVHGETEHEALERYAAAERKHAEIEARPVTTPDPLIGVDFPAPSEPSGGRAGA